MLFCSGIEAAKYGCLDRRLRNRRWRSAAPTGVSKEPETEGERPKFDEAANKGHHDIVEVELVVEEFLDDGDDSNYSKADEGHVPCEDFELGDNEHTYEEVEELVGAAEESDDFVGDLHKLNFV